jgi:transmembrane sensor
MHDYTRFTIDDFFWDDSFRHWVLSPTRELDTFWQQWLIQHPQKEGIVREARQLVQAIGLPEFPLSDDEIRQAVHQASIRSRQLPEVTPYQGTIRPLPIYRQRWWQLAASVLLILGMSYWLWHTEFSQNSTLADQLTYENQIAKQPTKLTETVNNGQAPLSVQFSDGSLVVLHPKARISYAAQFSGPRREVYLSGEAYFEVQKDPARPFFIFANELVTKVLGTSFLIRANPADKEVTVEVKTGKVAVFAQLDPKRNQKITDRELSGVVLLPNQKIVYARDAVRLTKSLVENPVIVTPPSVKSAFVFDETPLPRVFDALEKAYSVDIVYDESLFANCPLTATLTDQTLFEKLDIICRVSQAHYMVLDGQIIIQGPGCQP